ncbi:MAG TPA: M28 family peptidase [Terriglobales bacterium]|nr:M28 family peptidase [Terriglobales bacterium]
MKNSVLIFLLIASSFATAGKNKTPAVAPAPETLPAMRVAMNTVNSQNIRTQVQFLSSDLLEGRGTGQRGGDIAASYIAAQLALYGLKPAGDNGSYLQRVPMVGVATDPSSIISLAIKDTLLPLHLNSDVVAIDQSQSAISDVDAPLVYVGYGIVAPEYKWDDYKGLDVKGKVLLMLVNEPPSDDANFFKGRALTYYGRWTYKYEEAARLGAAGVILIHQPEMASYGWEVVRNSWGGERAYLRAENTPKLKLASWIQFDVAQKIAGSIGKSADDLIRMANSRDFKPVALPVEVRAHMVSKIRPFESNNVLAELPGSDEKLKSQGVLYSAHYDHLGIRPGTTGDNIYNGAVDNATGCGMLLEIARGFASAPEAPRRSILFAAVTGEEQGLLGSDYLSTHLPIPAGDITLAMNFDGIRPDGIPETIQLSGVERTNFYLTAAGTAKEFGFDIKGESNPAAGEYYRSDHFSFAHVGIPAFSVQEGLKYKGHPLEWGVQREEDYDQHRYHQPGDEFDPNWDFTGLAELSRFGIELGWKAAMQDELIQWLPNDEFEPTRKASEQSK